MHIYIYVLFFTGFCNMSYMFLSSRHFNCNASSITYCDFDASCGELKRSLLIGNSFFSFDLSKSQQGKHLSRLMCLAHCI